MAGCCGYPRNSVWKLRQQLRVDGHCLLLRSPPQTQLLCQLVRAHQDQGEQPSACWCQRKSPQVTEHIAALLQVTLVQPGRGRDHHNKSLCFHISPEHHPTLLSVNADLFSFIVKIYFVVDLNFILSFAGLGIMDLTSLAVQIESHVLSSHLLMSEQNCSEIGDNKKQSKRWWMSEGEFDSSGLDTSSHPCSSNLETLW